MPSADGSLATIVGEPSTAAGEYRLSVAGTSRGVGIHHIADETHESSVLFAGAVLRGETALGAAAEARPADALAARAADTCRLAFYGHGFEPGIDVVILIGQRERPTELATVRATSDGWIADAYFDAGRCTCGPYDLRAGDPAPGHRGTQLPPRAVHLHQRDDPAQGTLLLPAPA
jgi:hypothetical protein